MLRWACGRPLGRPWHQPWRLMRHGLLKLSKVLCSSPEPVQRDKVRVEPEMMFFQWSPHGRLGMCIQQKY